MSRKMIIARLIGAGCTEEWCSQFKTEDLKDILKDIDEVSFSASDDLEIEELKAKYATGKYIAYCILKNEDDIWDRMITNPTFSQKNVQYKLILKEHSKIADAVIANPDVEVLWQYCETDTCNAVKFFENYNEDFVYLLKEQPKQVSEQPKLNNFEDFGFTADFEGEILKDVDGYYIGYVMRQPDNRVLAMRWDDTGQDCNNFGYNLTPIKKEWSEDESNFPALLVSDMYNIITKNIEKSYVSVINKEAYDSYMVGCSIIGAKNTRVATKAERDSLFCKED